MEVRYEDSELERLESDPSFRGKWSQSVVKAFRKRMQAIRAATDERAFYQMKSFHFEKLAGNRRHQRSMRLNDQFRLILKFEGKSPDKTVVVISIEDYH
ncbi:MAG: plasmid maintenance system killer protein [Chloroflexi bacterium]|nr:plasmid maintenance system killer protein [Chloroflexota bacterium]